MHEQAAPAWRLAVRPDLPTLVTTAPTSTQPPDTPCSAFIIAPAQPGGARDGTAQDTGSALAMSGTSRGSIAATATATRCFAWRATAGAGGAAVLPEVADAAEVVWSASHGCWQVASAVFGVLLLKDSSAADARLPVAPLLDAAIARHLAGARTHVWS